MSITNILDLNNRIDVLEKFAHNVEPIQQQIDELKAWTDSGTKDASGNPIILTDGVAFNAVDLNVSLEPIQSGSGTPSPENVRPITGYTECVVDVKDEDETTQATATITFGQTVYGGSVDFKTGKVLVYGEYLYVDGSDTSILGVATGQLQIAISSNSKTTTDIYHKVGDLLCNRFDEIYNNSSATDGIYYRANGSHNLLVRGNNYTAETTLSDWVTWLGNNPLQIIYGLATPTELTLTPAELELLKGYNYITTNGTTIDLTYQPDNLKADILLTVSQLYGSKISIFDAILTGGDTGQVLTKTSDDNYDATWETLPATRTTMRKSEK